MSFNFDISPPEDFERRAVVRAWVSSVGHVPIPDGFEDRVMQQVHRKTVSTWFTWSRVVFAVFSLAGLVAVTWPAPDLVRVVYAPSTPLPLVDLYNLPPAPVTDMPQVPTKAVPRPTRRVVAGY